MSFQLFLRIHLKGSHPKLVTDSDFAPYLLFYMSRELDPYGLFQRTLEYKQIGVGGEGQQQQKTFDAPITRDISKYLEYEHKQNCSVSKVKHDVRSSKSTLGIMLFCRKYIDVSPTQTKSYWRYEPIGRVVIPIEYLINNALRTPLKSYDFDIVDQTDVKSDDQTRSRISIQSISFVADPKEFKLLKDVQDINKHMEQYKYEMKKWFDYYCNIYGNVLQSTNPKFKRMHVPKWYATIEIPSVFYMTYLPREKPDLKFLDCLLNMALGSYELSPDWFIDTIRFQMIKRSYNYDINICAKILACASTIFANSADYLSDISLGEDTERFINIGLTFAGDCEDLAKEAYLVWMMIKQAKHHPNIEAFPLVKQASYLSEYYICGLTTCVACTKSLGSNTEEDQSSSSTTEMEGDTCHMIATVLPRKYFFEALSRGNKNNNGLNAEQIQQMKLQAKTYKILPERVEEGLPGNWEQELPVLILEGTNWCTALQKPLHTYLPPNISAELRERVIDNQKLIQGAKILIGKQFKTTIKRLPLEVEQMNVQINDPHEVSENAISAFYRRQNNFLTVIDGVGIYDLSIGYTDKKNVYSVDFRDYISASKAVNLSPVFVLTPKQIEIGLTIVDMEVAITPRVLPDVEKVKKILISKSEPLRRLLEIEDRYKPRSFKIIDRPSSFEKMDYKNEFMTEDERKIYAFTRNALCYKVNHINKLSMELVDDFERLLEQGELKHANGKTIYINALKVEINPLCYHELYIIEIKLYVSRDKK